MCLSTFRPIPHSACGPGYGLQVSHSHFIYYLTTTEIRADLDLGYVFLKEANHVLHHALITAEKELHKYIGKTASFPGHSASIAVQQNNMHCQQYKFKPGNEATRPKVAVSTLLARS